MIVRYWQPFREIEAVRKQLDQVFDEFVGSGNGVETTWTPAATLIDMGNVLELQVQLPGVKTEDVDIQASRELVSISGSRKAPQLDESDCVIRNEVRYGAFHRVVALPIAIQPDQVQASYDSGVLTIRLPKTEAAINRVVKVSISGLEAAPEQPVLESEATEETAA